jgi:quercetin dioxygenase-like cupin family protein
VLGEQTKGQYSIMEQLMPAAAGPPPHAHEHGDEIFYVLDGEMAMQLGDQVIVAAQGQIVRVPAGTTHAFAVKSKTARVLNFYVPAGLDLQVAMLGTPATAPTLPPEGAQRPPSREAQEAFSSRLHDLATQTMAADTDLLGDYRSAAPSDGAMP